MLNNPRFSFKPISIYTTILILSSLFTSSIAQSVSNDGELKKRFTRSFYNIANILVTNGSFKQAVILTENSFIPTLCDSSFYTIQINDFDKILKRMIETVNLKNYRFGDSLNFKKNYLINQLFGDTISFHSNSSLQFITPFLYDFNDSNGDVDWTNTFVSNLLITHKGNCRSLTYLYKILADELGAKCWLSLAPNHIYIRNYSKQIGWYNTELTSGTFPTDAWIAATGYVNVDAIRSGVYMDTLSNQQSIGLCLMDLAHGYIKQTKNYTDSFVLKCCNLVLQYHSVNPEALLTKAEALKRMYLKQKEENNPIAQTIYDEMEQTYITLVKLGYREMPYKAYQKWLKTAKHNKERYQNKKLNDITQKK